MSNFAKLSYNQRKIFKLVVEGYTDSAIAERLDKAPSAIAMQMTKIYKKLGVSDPTRKKHPRVLACLMYRKRYPERNSGHTES